MILHRKIFTFNFARENTYILYNDAQEAIVMDPGYYTEAERSLFWQFIAEHHLRIQYILLTHTHLDHVFGLCDIVEKTGLLPYIHPEEKAMLAYLESSSVQWRQPMDIYRGEVQYIREGERLIWGEVLIEILHLPGHTPGSIGFYFPEWACLYSGDVLFRRAIGRTDLYLANENQLIQSIRNKLFTLPDEVSVYPGHGAPTSIGKEKAYHFFA